MRFLELATCISRVLLLDDPIFVILINLHIFDDKESKEKNVELCAETQSDACFILNLDDACILK